MRIFSILFLITLSVKLFSQAGDVLSLTTIKHADIQSNPAVGSNFGQSVISVGDLNKDGVEDVAVGAPFQGPSSNQGYVYIIFLNANGTLKSFITVGTGLGGFTGSSGSGGGFGESLANLGDLNGDGNIEIAVGNPYKTYNGYRKGCVWILSLDSTGVINEVEVSTGLNGFSHPLDHQEAFGVSLSSFPDYNGDGRKKLLIGSEKDTVQNNSGRVYLIDIDSSLSVSNIKKYDITSPLIENKLGSGLFGRTVTYLNDIDNNGIPEMLVGIPGDPISTPYNGSFWMLFLDNNLDIMDTLRIYAKVPGWATSTGDTLARLGDEICNLGDIDGDSIDDIAVYNSLGNNYADSTDRIRILYLNSDGSIKKGERLKGAPGFSPFTGITSTNEFDGYSLAVMNDLNGDDKRDLVAGNIFYNTNRGQVHILTLDGIQHPNSSIRELANPAISLKVFPNPANGPFTVELPKNWAGDEVYVQYTDTQGKVLEGFNYKLNGKVQLQGEINAPAGMYYVNIQNQKGEVASATVLVK